MKAILLGILFLSGTFVVGQPADSSSTEIKKINGDSIVTALQKRRDSLVEAIYLADSNLRKQQFQNNTNYILRLQQENKAKQKKAAMIRIAIGVGFLAILIFGLSRRRKYQSKTK